MFFHVQKLINKIVPDQPDPPAANALQEVLGGQFGEIRMMMQYFFQSFNVRGNATPYKDLIQAIGLEEMSNVELTATTINHLLGDSSSNEGSTPLKKALEAPNIHHMLLANRCAVPVDAAGNPWSGSSVYASGNLILDLLYDLMLEATGRLQKCRLYEMSDNKTFRGTVSFLIVRDHAHELMFAKALESLGVQWGKTLPIPAFDATQWPEVKKLMDRGLHLHQHHFRLDGSAMASIVKGRSPVDGSANLDVPQNAPEGFTIGDLPQRPEEFSPGLTPELNEMIKSALQMSI